MKRETSIDNIVGVTSCPATEFLLSPPLMFLTTAAAFSPHAALIDPLLPMDILRPCGGGAPPPPRGGGAPPPSRSAFHCTAEESASNALQRTQLPDATFPVAKDVTWFGVWRVVAALLMAVEAAMRYRRPPRALSHCHLLN